MAEDSTHPHAPHAHVTLATWHTGLLFSRETADLTATFLATGEFPGEFKKVSATKSRQSAP